MGSLGCMRETIDLIRPKTTRDKTGFTTSTDEIVATVRAGREQRHASNAWVNRAAYTKADVLFRIRVIPGVTVCEAMEIAAFDGRHVIDSVEPVGRYLEILAHQVSPEGKGG